MAGEKYLLSEGLMRRVADVVRWAEGRMAGADLRTGAGQLTHGRPPKNYFRIVSNDGSGAYTVRQQTWSESGLTLGDAASWHEYTGKDLTGYDVRADAGGAAGEVVAGWWAWTGTQWTLLLDILNSPTGLVGATGIQVWCSKTVDINLGDDTHQFYTVDSRDWRGRQLWLSVLGHSGEPGTDTGNVWRRTRGRDDFKASPNPHKELQDWVQPEAVYLDFSADIWIYCVASTDANIGAPDAFDAMVMIDGDDGGKLKLEVWNASGNRWQYWVRAEATEQKDEDSPDITAPD